MTPQEIRNRMAEWTRKLPPDQKRILVQRMREYVAGHKISKAQQRRATENMRRLTWLAEIDESNTTH